MIFLPAVLPDNAWLRISLIKHQESPPNCLGLDVLTGWSDES